MEPSIHVHKLTLEALWSVLRRQFKQWAQENNKVISEDLQSASAKVAKGFALKTDEGIQSSTEELLSKIDEVRVLFNDCLLYTSPSPRDLSTSRMPSSA